MKKTIIALSLMLLGYGAFSQKFTYRNSAEAKLVHVAADMDVKQSKVFSFNLGINQTSDSAETEFMQDGSRKLKYIVLPFEVEAVYDSNGFLKKLVELAETNTYVYTFMNNSNGNSSELIDTTYFANGKEIKSMKENFYQEGENFLTYSTKWVKCSGTDDETLENLFERYGFGLNVVLPGLSEVTNYTADASFSGLSFNRLEHLEIMMKGYNYEDNGVGMEKLDAKLHLLYNYDPVNATIEITAEELGNITGRLKICKFRFSDSGMGKAGASTFLDKALDGDFRLLLTSDPK